MTRIAQGQEAVINSNLLLHETVERLILYLQLIQYGTVTDEPWTTESEFMIVCQHVSVLLKCLQSSHCALRGCCFLSDCDLWPLGWGRRKITLCRNELNTMLFCSSNGLHWHWSVFLPSGTTPKPPPLSETLNCFVLFVWSSQSYWLSSVTHLSMLDND